MSGTKKFIIVALSGGVDSAVTASLLGEQGHTVVGAFMKNWSGSSGASPCWVDERRDAYRIAAHLGIPVVTMDFEKEYRRNVVEYMCEEYAAGRTPNPDVVCNCTIKFGLFLKETATWGADCIATGHYARVVRDGSNVVHLYKGFDSSKDQSYFLHGLTQHQLQKVLFPLGEYAKDCVRRMAQERGIPVAHKRSTRGICFVGKVSLPVFLKERIPARVGNVVDTDGNIMGIHEGIQYVTIGQRHGLSIPGNGRPYFIVDKNYETNVITVAFGNDHPRLYSQGCVVNDIHWIVPGMRNQKLEMRNVTIKLRYRHEGVKARIEEHCGATRIVFAVPQRAVTPGQFAVLYEGDECLGGGPIESIIA